jgi:hypothetical protein
LIVAETAIEERIGRRIHATLPLRPSNSRSPRKFSRATIHSFDLCIEPCAKLQALV